MRKLFFIGLVAIAGLASCDKVENIYPQGVIVAGSYDLYPEGDSAHYAANAWPTFSANLNTDRNILIEDFTGHTCTYCPAAAAAAEQIASNYPGRVLISTVHTSELGLGGFQEIELPYFITDFTNTNGLAIGMYFGQDWPGSNFVGNPKGMVNRGPDPAQPVLGPASWSGEADALMSANDLKTNIQSSVNYYPSTRGVFLHTELEILDAALVNDLYVVVQLHEDSIVAAQKFNAGTFPEPYPYDHIDTNYVHRDVMRGCIDGKTFGQMLDTDHLDANGKYYFNYIYKLPAEYEATNMHVLIYIRDSVTEEVYHVIKQYIQ